MVYLKFVAKMRLHTIQEYIKSMEGFLESTIKEVEKDLAKEEKTELTKEEQQEIGEYYADIHYTFAEEFPRILRNSLFVFSYSMIENSLNNFCDFVKHHYKLKLTLSDLKGRGVERARTYLKKVAEIDFPDGKEWAEIKYYNRIRNFVVHNNGELDDSGDASEVERYIEAKSDLLDLKKDMNGNEVVSKAIVIKRDFCKEVLRTARDFLFQLDDVYQAWAKNKKNSSEHR